MKIASLLPSATEIVYALGLEEHLVGVTFECDYPPQARADAAIVVGGIEMLHLSPAEIDAAVRDKLVADDNLYELQIDRLRALQPDLILTQDLCRVLCGTQRTGRRSDGHHRMLGRHRHPRPEHPR